MSGSAGASQSVSASDSQNKGVSFIAPSQRKQMEKNDLDPNKKYLSCNIVKGSAFVDFVNVRQDEYLSVTVSFLKNRFST